MAPVMPPCASTCLVIPKTTSGVAPAARRLHLRAARLNPPGRPCPSRPHRGPGSVGRALEATTEIQPELHLLTAAFVQPQLGQEPQPEGLLERDQRHPVGEGRLPQ